MNSVLAEPGKCDGQPGKSRFPRPRPRRRYGYCAPHEFREALIEENGQTFVQIQKGDAVERRAVTGARIHGSRAILVEGVSEGDIVVLDQSPR